MALHQESWFDHAACRGADGSLFYPAESNERPGERARRETKAKEVCAGCEVVESCLADALTRNELYGVWGGKNENERRALVRLLSPAELARRNASENNQ